MAMMDWLLGLALGLLLAGCGGGEAASDEATGLIDSSFEAKGLSLMPGTIFDILELSDGSLLLAGSSGFVAKLKADGTLDTTFARGGVDATRRGTAVTQSTVQLAPFPQGAITVIEIHSSPCVAGFCDDFIGDVVVRRMNENGVGDGAYGVSGIATLRAARGSIVVSPDGRVTAYARRLSRQRTFFQVQSLDAAGNPDPGFGGRAQEAVGSCRGRVLPYDDPEPRSVVATSAGDQTLVAASWPNSGLCLVRLDARGSLDATFAVGGQRGVPLDQLPNSQLPLLAVILRADGEIVVVMAPKTRETSGPIVVPAFLFFTRNGDLASVTRSPNGFPTFMVDAVTQPNGKLVSVGFPTAESGSMGAPQLWRSVPSASAYDGSFGPFAAGYTTLASGSLVLLPEKVAVDRAGRILVSGSDPVNQPAVMRFR